jgi:hypothetical protein
VVTGCGPPSLPKFVSRRSVRANRLVGVIDLLVAWVIGGFHKSA